LPTIVIKGLTLKVAPITEQGIQERTVPADIQGRTVLEVTKVCLLDMELVVDCISESKEEEPIRHHRGTLGPVATRKGSNLMDIIWADRQGQGGFHISQLKVK
jgi:hypothetical protein